MALRHIPIPGVRLLWASAPSALQVPCRRQAQQNGRHRGRGFAVLGRVPLLQPLQGWSAQDEASAGLSLPLLVGKEALLRSGSNFKLLGEGSPADPVTQGLAWSLPPWLGCEGSCSQGCGTGTLAALPSLQPCSRALPPRGRADGLGGLGSSTHLLSVQYLVFCKSRVQ